MTKAPLSHRVRYAFDNLMSRGTVVLIGWLGLATLLLVIIATLVDLLIGGRSDQLGPFQVFWNILSQALTPNPVDPGYPWQFLVVMFLVTLASLLIVSILIGVLTTGIQGRLERLRKGRSRVVENDHIVIIGWSEQIFAIIQQLVIANASRRHSAIVVLGDQDKVEMEDQIRAKCGRTGRTAIVCRSGSPLEPGDIYIVSPDTARSIILLPPDDDDPDSHVINGLLALFNVRRPRSAPYHVVANIREPKNATLARIVGREEVEVVLHGDLIARIMAQTCQQTGLSVVYTELLNFEGDEIYFQTEPSLSGRTFGEALFAYEDSAVIGLQFADGSVRVKPPMETVVQPGDRIIAIARDDTTTHLSGSLSPAVDRGAIREKRHKPPAAMRALVLGWNESGEAIIRQLDAAVGEGSLVTVVAGPAECAALTDCCRPLSHLAMETQAGDITDRELLDGLNVPGYDHVLVLTSSALAPQRADAHTLVTLLHLRDIREKSDAGFSIVTEMQDARDRNLADVARAEDFVVSDQVISLVLAQVAENKGLNAVFEQILDRRGATIHLLPIEDYIVTGTAVSFYTLLEAARSREEVAIGYRQARYAEDATRAYGIVINPVKALEVTFQPGDAVIVLTEA